MTRSLPIIAILLVSSLAHAQGTSGDDLFPTGSVFEIRVVIPDAKTTSICAHEVKVTGTGTAAVVTAVDKNADGAITAADAFVCKTSGLVTDGVGVNTMTYTASPPLTAPLQFAVRSYDGTGANDPAPSALSNWKRLRSMLLAPWVL